MPRLILRLDSRVESLLMLVNVRSLESIAFTYAFDGV